MAVLVHITGEDKQKSIKNTGIKIGKDNNAIFFMPVLNEYLISHQWARELKRFGVKNFIAVYFRLNNNEEIWFGKYSEEHKKMPLNTAIELFQEIEDKLGYEFFIEKKIESSEITKIRHISKPMGWRYEPSAHGKKPCGCPVCLQKGGYKTSYLREDDQSDKISREEAKNIIKTSNDEDEICDALLKLSGKWRKESPEYLKHLLSFKDEFLLHELAGLLAEFKHPLAKKYLAILTKSEYEDIREFSQKCLDNIILGKWTN